MSSRASLLGCAVFSLMAIAARPFTLDAAESAVCTPKGKPAPLGFTLKDMNGKDVALSAYKGKVVLLDFWATWCGPCKIEIPGFVDLYQKYEARGLAIVGVSIDDPPATLKPFAEQFRMNYPVLVGLGREDLQNAFGPLVGYPTAFLIKRDGTICAQHTGFTPKEQFEREIKALL